RHGLLYQPSLAKYKLDSANLTMTHSQLLTNIQKGDTITFMGVPPGSGTRMGIDRDEDGILDADVPAPALQIAQSSGQAVINWPYSAAGFALETTPTFFSPAWTNPNDPIEILSNRNYVTNLVSGGSRFYRLHLQ